jgi:mannose-6-phosphate isomerase-like protein (cupin superfamily)
MRTATRPPRSRAALVVGVVGLCIGAAFAVEGTVVARAAAKQEPVTRTILGETKPSNAPGQDLTLQQVTVQPGAKLPTHFHEGTQVASIRAGVLTYTIESGSATVTHAGGDPEVVVAPATVTLKPGDGLVETASLVHHAENKGNKPVVIVLTALLRDGAPLATLVGDGASGTTLVHLQTVLQSQSRTLLQAGPNNTVTYGTNQLAGTSTFEGQPVTIQMLANVDYVNGSGSFFGFVTFTFADGSTIGTRMQGLATAAADGSLTTFTSTLGVVGGTGRYVSTTGSGTFVGERRTALGGDVTATFDLELTTKAS